MPDCFISYASQDERLARFIHDELQSQGLSAFMAAVSLKPGQHWSETIRQNIQGSTLVIFLASRAACASQWVQQELGFALAGAKTILPVIWEIDPTQLPGWMKEKQALDMRGSLTVENVKAQVAAIATKLKGEKAKGFLMLGAVVAAVIALAS